jgi:hypothetical protein
VTMSKRERPHICPLDRSWRTRTLGGQTTGRLDDSASQRVARASQLTLDSNATSLSVEWELALDDVTLMPVDPVREPDLVPGSPRHRHATFDVGGHTVHVDWLSARHSKPTFAFIEYRVFVDGALAARGGRMQVSVGAPRNLPAKALIDDTRLLVIRDPPHHAIDVPGVIKIGRPVVRKPLVPPFIVSSGVLRLHEYELLPRDLQRTLERETQRFVERYGEDLLRDDPDRHRADLEFVYGI